MNDFTRVKFAVDFNETMVRQFWHQNYYICLFSC